jgi:curved DNA-binding protein CbpA
MLNPYSVLGLDATATEDDIRAAYRKLAAQVHPDLQPPDRRDWASEEMKRLNEARDVLLDPKRRAGYDVHVRPPTEPGRTFYNDYAYPKAAYRRRSFRLWPALGGLAFLTLIGLGAAAMLIAPTMGPTVQLAFNLFLRFISVIVSVIVFVLGLAFVAFIVSISTRGR